MYMLKSTKLINLSWKSMTLKQACQFAKKNKKLTDQEQLTQEEIDSILMKPKEGPKQPQPAPEQKITIEPTYYNRNIDEIIDHLIQQDPILQKSKKHEQAQQKQQEKQKEEIKSEPKQEIVEKTEEKKVSPIKYYKYDLPIPNVDPDIQPPDYGTAVKKPPLSTPTMNIFNLLELNKDSSYEEYENKVQAYINHQDMYGGVLKSPEEERNELKEFMKEFAVPISALKDEKYMEQKRRCWSLNLSMPGAIENEHPHRFLKLRPVEEFRHTPLIPISDRQMKDFNERVEMYHRKGFFFEIKKEQIYQGIFVIGVSFIMIKMFQVALRMEEESGLAFQRLKLRRMGIIQDM